MTLREKVNDVKRQLETRFSADEAEAMVRVIFDHLLDYSPIDIVIHASREITDYTCQRADSIVSRVLNDEPLQYVIGEARFYGCRLKVTPDVLIPRPETEELVDIIVDRHRYAADLHVLDIATGSGCIAIALARNLRFPSVEALDISAKALDIAKENAKSLKANVAFRQSDILALPTAHDEYDIIVSNPPYVLESERANMAANVLLHEPAIALFVPDSDPLRFYRPIIDFSAEALKKGGCLYLEINPLCAKELRRSAEQAGFRNVEIIKDMARHDRFLTARK